MLGQMSAGLVLRGSLLVHGYFSRMAFRDNLIHLLYHLKTSHEPMILGEMLCLQKVN